MTEPVFAIWNNRHTKQLLLNGIRKTNVTSVSLPLLASILQQVNVFEDDIESQGRKAFYYDAVLQSRTLISTILIAKEPGMSAIALNKIPHEKKIIYKNDAQ